MIKFIDIYIIGHGDNIKYWYSKTFMIFDLHMANDMFVSWPLIWLSHGH